MDFTVKDGISILDACKYIGITIPRFCYHELLSVSGNCRMCLVEVEPLDKPIASCVFEVYEDISVKINTPFVKKARENAMEILLINHPLDCPICDQAGECDLQDQAKLLGSTFSRTFFNRKGVEDKYCGPLIKTIMTRCISCTRCVRFGSEIAGIDYFGTLNRGNSTEIGSYIQKVFVSEISGNVIDLCPVGALTSRPYAFKSRPWELRVAENIDTTDALGSNIYVHFKETEIFRVVPKINTNINLSLLSDKARFSYDANNRNRIKNIRILDKSTKNYRRLTWDLFFNKVEEVSTFKESLTIILNNELDLSSLIAIKSILRKNINKINTLTLESEIEASNFYSPTNFFIKESIEYSDKAIFLLGTNIRSENALINTRLRIEANKNFVQFYSFGLSYDNTIPTSFIYFSTIKILNIFEGHLLTLAKSLLINKNTLTIIGSAFRNRIQNYTYLKQFIDINNLNINILDLYSGCNSAGLNWSGLLSSKQRKKFGKIFTLNIQDNFFSRSIYKKASENFVYINTHPSFLSQNATYILPSKTNFEAEHTFLNLEYISQQTSACTNGYPNSRSINEILLSVFDPNMKKTLYGDHLIEQANLKFYNKSKMASIFQRLIKKNNTFFINCLKLSFYPLRVNLKIPYLTNHFTRNSQNMINCFKEYNNYATNFC